MAPNCENVYEYDDRLLKKAEGYRLKYCEYNIQDVHAGLNSKTWNHVHFLTQISQHKVQVPSAIYSLNVQDPETVRKWKKKDQNKNWP